MCVSCGCWFSPDKGGDGNHPENASVMPNVPTTTAPTAGSTKK